MAFKTEELNIDTVCELGKKLLTVVENENYSDACEALRFALRMLPIRFPIPAKEPKFIGKAIFGSTVSKTLED